MVQAVGQDQHAAGGAIMRHAICRIVGDFQRPIEADGKHRGGIPVRRQAEGRAEIQHPAAPPDQFRCRHCVHSQFLKARVVGGSNVGWHRSERGQRWQIIGRNRAPGRDCAHPTSRQPLRGAWLAGDRAALAACYHDDFTLHYFGRNPLAGDHGGKPAALAILAEVTRRTNRQLLAIVDVMAGPSAARYWSASVSARRQDGRSRAPAGVHRARRTALGMLDLRPGPGAGRRLSHVKPVQTAFPIGFAFRAGIVIAATPTTTQASPIHAVEVNCSPRKTTPTATPIGTRR